MSVPGRSTVTHHVAVPGYSAAQGNFRNFEMPPVTLGVADDVPSAALSKRKYPLWVGAPRTEKGDVTRPDPCGLEGRVRAARSSRAPSTASAYSSACDDDRPDRVVSRRDQARQARARHRAVRRVPRRAREAAGVRASRRAAHQGVTRSQRESSATRLRASHAWGRDVARGHARCNVVRRCGD